jgi:hypothetical protein
MKSSEVVLTSCGRVMAAWLEGPLEVMDSLSGLDYKATH